ncbi:hypothetical protein PV326_000474 [Microctonus aethiopoides]|nr:hypothetical protein PV326_000474 [Microctonus aethiopoides]
MGGGAAVSGQPTAPRVRITSDISVGLPTGDINGTKSMSLALHNSGTIPQSRANRQNRTGFTRRGFRRAQTTNVSERIVLKRTDILLLTGRWTGVACTDRST